jgi:predicted transcriptional regulator
MPNENQMAAKLVEDIMHRGVITCKTYSLLKEVVRIIADTDVHALVVIHDNEAVAGILSHMDLLRLYGQNLLDYKAEDVMKPNVITIAPTAPIKEAIALMLENNIRRLLVTEDTPDGERAIGVISTTDVIRDMREHPWFW